MVNTEVLGQTLVILKVFSALNNSVILCLFLNILYSIPESSHSSAVGLHFDNKTNK